MALPLFVGAFIMCAGFLKGFIPPLARLIDQQLNYDGPNEILDVSTHADLYARGLESESDYFTNMRKLGVNSSLASKLLTGHKQYLSAIDLISLYRRGEIPYDLLVEQAKSLRIDKDHIQLWLKAAEFFPSPPDLIRFAIREVYSPEVSAKYGQFEDLPEKYIEESFKAGLPVEQAKNYWAAHWELPSLGMGYEMAHRRIISMDDLKVLMRSLDIMPFWRDKLIQLSYNPLTRVDVRRMYGLGVLGVEDVLNSYLDIGYSPENAKLMTEFTVKYENVDVEGLTRDTVISGYKKGVIDDDELRAYLVTFGYPLTVVEFWMQTASYDKAVSKIEAYKNDLIQLYQMGDLSIDDIRQRLISYDLPLKYVDQVLADTILMQAARRKVPTKDELEDWLINGTIDDIYYNKQMKALGYSDKNIIHYLTDINLRVKTLGRKQLPATTYKLWYKGKIIDEQYFREALFNIGISERDIETFIQEGRENNE